MFRCNEVYVTDGQIENGCGRYLIQVFPARVYSEIMAFRLQDIKYVDSRTKDLMFGYLHGIRQGAVIPDLVLNICLLFYYQREYFAFVANGCEGEPNFELSNDDKTASLIDGKYGTVYGNVALNSLAGTICNWRIKLMSNDAFRSWDPAESIYLGISANKQTDQIIDPWTVLPPNTFFYKGTQGYGHPKSCIQQTDGNGLGWKSEDIVDIRLDLNQRSVEYFINDKPTAMGFSNIPTGADIEYRLILNMRHNGQMAIILGQKFL